MNWAEVDWAALDRLRQGFLAAQGSVGAYWQSREDLASYDFTYAERIGWKWDAVLEELRLRGWRPPGGLLLDWACGSGIAGRRVVRTFGPGGFSRLQVWDHSSLAREFAAARAAEDFPSLSAAVADPGFLSGQDPIGLLVVSHVLNELDAAGRAELAALARRAQAVLWVEPGAKEVSRKLSRWHDQLGDRFQRVGPCTHQNSCPILAPGNEAHWCHHFARPPGYIFVDPNWTRFGRRAGVDLRSLPYSFLALDRQPVALLAEGYSHVIGRPETFKPYVRLLNCDQTGLGELMVQKRDNAALYKELGRAKGPLVYAWRREGAKIQEAVAALDSAPLP